MYYGNSLFACYLQKSKLDFRSSYLHARPPPPIRFGSSVLDANKIYQMYIMSAKETKESHQHLRAKQNYYLIWYFHIYSSHSHSIYMGSIAARGIAFTYAHFESDGMESNGTS